MSQHIVLPNGYEANLTIEVINNISISYRLTDLTSNDDVDFWKLYTSNLTSLVSASLLKYYEQLNFVVSADAYYVDNAGYLTQEISRVNKEHAVLYRQSENREEKIETMFDEIVDPGEWANTQGTFHYELQSIDNFSSIGFSFGIPFTYNARALSTNFRLNTGLEVSKYIEYLPYNSDDYCIMHCIFNELHDKFGTNHLSLNADEDYMEEFTKWFVTNRLKDYYLGSYFDLNKISDLEVQLENNLTVYTLHDGKPEIYYRSQYQFGQEPIHILIIPQNQFFNKKTKKFFEVKSKDGVTPGFNDLPFFTNISTSSWMNCSYEAHAAVLNINYFRKFSYASDENGVMKKTKDRDDRYSVCSYCCGSFIKDKLVKHRFFCLKNFSNSSARERIREYKEMKNPIKKFDSLSTMYRTPFVTFDFETRVIVTVEDGKEMHNHVPYSYALLYTNVFDMGKSIIKHKVLKNHDKLIDHFLDDVESLTVYHHDIMQSVDHADPLAKGVAEKPEVCPHCKLATDNWEYNHSHFQNDTLNTHLNGYICDNCNKKMQVRNKPLKFFAHNGSKFDFSLFMKKMLNDNEFRGFKFLAKTESRFTQVEGYVNNPMYKFSFNDSRMMLVEGLGKLSAAWVTDSDKPDISKLLNKFYKTNVSDSIVDLSLKKAVFPYEALCKPDDTMDCLEPLDKSWFFDNLSKQEISDENYQTYLDSYKTLQDEFDGFTFRAYHDYYLLLDVLLLSIILKKFMNICHDNSGLNPLAFVSSSSFSMKALLKYNLENKVGSITIPEVAVQKFIQKSIHGGFTMVFNKQMKNFDLKKDFSYYVDFSSLYPSVMSGKKLPTKFIKWLENPTVEYMRGNEKKYYFFAEIDIAPLDPKFQKKVSNYPLFPENFELTKDHLSEDQLMRYRINGQKSTICKITGDEILKPKEFIDRSINTVTFYEKKNYTTSWTYLKQAIDVGYEVTKIHKVAMFEQDFVLKGYIDKMYVLKRNGSIEKGKLADIIKTSTGEEKERLEAELSALESRISVFKLILNAIYGQCIINSDLHSEVKMFDIDTVDDEDPLLENLGLKKAISSMRFKSLLKVGDKCMVSMMKSSYDLPYPLMVGSAILFESKLLMSRFIYTMYDWLETMEPKDGEEKVSLFSIYTDTDSSVFQLKNIQNHFKSRQEFGYAFNKQCYSLFDTTGWDAKYSMPETHDALAHLKDETKGKQIIEFNAVTAKCYSCLLEADANGKHELMLKGKGINKSLQKLYLSHKLYGDVITGKIFTEEYDDVSLSCSFGTINSKQMKLFNTDVKKSIVTIVDLKSYYSENSEHHYIYGSKEHLDATRG